ncbi:SMI1/KNR4 family protein [Streptomyces justiciae]|uniref:SMI1/KNR4 family protein n=1 Tax=Streptomyces justiciae TaxID=2780140 RepID=UPI001D14BE2A|nr:SMI1/KNR4 family protein [Streptomyces justiciae]
MAPIPPPLTEAEVADAERELGVAFPAEYCAYLRGVSAGGAVSRLALTERGWAWENNEALAPESLALPFPHPDSYAAEDYALVDREPRAEDFADQHAYADAWRNWDEECGAFEDRKTAGAIVAQEHGCGFATFLALTGPLAGTLWWDGRATCGLIVPLSLDRLPGTPPITFAAWLGRNSWDLLPAGWG